MELKRCIKDPIPEIFEAASLLSNAADAHNAGDRTTAELMFREANKSALWRFLNPAWGPSPKALALNVVVMKPADDTLPAPNSARDSKRNPSLHTKREVLQRDGFRCRYCGIPVVPADIRKAAHGLYPDAVPWDAQDVQKQHAAFQCLWLQYDHVVPHHHGGASTADNIVVTCALCNFGKDRYTIQQLGISDPRLRSPVPIDWDGLERLRPFIPKTNPAATSIAAPGVRHTVRDDPIRKASMPQATATFDASAHRMTRSRWFEDFTVGERYPSPSRTVTSAEFAAFRTVSGDNHPIHYDRPFCQALGLSGLFAHGLQVVCFTAAGAGLFPHEATESMVAFLEQSSRFLRPVVEDDTLYPCLEIVECVPQRTTGIIVMRATIHNMRGELVLEGTQRYLLRKRPNLQRNYTFGGAVAASAEQE